MTILVRSGMRFNSADLRGIRIKGANLAGGEFDSADLRDADLTNVILDKCWLRQARLEGTRLRRARFGELPFINLSGMPSMSAFSTDGRLYAVAFTNGSIILFGTTNWSSVHTHQVSMKSVTTLAFSPKGGLLAYGDRTGMLGRWNYSRGVLMAFSSGHDDLINGLVYSPDGSRIATAGHDGKVAVWDADTGVCVKVMAPYTEGASSVAFLPDGRRLVSGGSDGIIRLWNLETGSLTSILEAHDGAISSALFSPDGRRIASSSSDKTIRIWSASTGTWSLEATCNGHSERVISIAYSPDGQHLASCSEDGTIRTWGSGGSGPIFRGHTDHVVSVAYSQCGTQLTSCGRDKVLRLWDCRAAVKGAVLFGRTNSITSGMYPYSTVKRQNSDSDKTIQPTRPRPLARTFESQSFGTVDTTCFAISSDGVLTASASRNDGTPTIIVCFGATSENRYTLNGHEKEISSVTFSPNNQSIASGDINGVLRVWNVETGETIWTREEHHGKIMDGHKGLQDSWLDTGFLWSGYSYNIYLRVFKERSSRRFDSWRRHSSALGHRISHSATIESISFSPVGDFIATGSRDSTVRIWDTATGTCLFLLEGHSGIVTSVVFSPDGTQVATSSLDQTLRWWNLSVHESGSLSKEGGGTLVSQSELHAMVPISAMQTDKEETSTQGTHGAAEGIYTHDDSGLFHAPVYSPDGSEISVISGQHGILRFDTRSKAPRPALVGHSDTATCIAYSPSGDRIATSSEDKTARVWEPQTGNELLKFVGHEGSITSIAFSPFSYQLATSSTDWSIRLWNVAGNTPNQEAIDKVLLRHTAPVLCIAYSPDGRLLASGSEDRTMRLWDSLTGDPLAVVGDFAVGVKTIQWRNSARGGLVLVTGCKENPLRVWEVVEGEGHWYEVRRCWGAGVDSLAVSGARLGQEHGLTEAACRLLKQRGTIVVSDEVGGA
ncbi:WD40 repeat-like protein [Linnemannia elongata AG-77]|uniref:WD40 repeat-like protein n=1 Tax=Linnemannia elongata AG-77 TaxID=1314771 RepID=A0A197K2X8_9FUNG|nr:WD40 repeat-like protein [Linnemannia elongata AG-77]